VIPEVLFWKTVQYKSSFYRTESCFTGVKLHLRIYKMTGLTGHDVQ